MKNRLQKFKQHLADNIDVYIIGTFSAAVLGLAGYAAYLDVKQFNETVDEISKTKKRLTEWGEDEFRQGRVVAALNDGTFISVRPEEINFFS